LQAFVSWLQSWEDLMILDVPKRAHKLSAETHFAFSFTTKNLIELSDYLLKELKLKHVLLDQFQTDVLERRFGQYRKLSGCNYNVSVKLLIQRKN
jgi:hypothetical protein